MSFVLCSCLDVEGAGVHGAAANSAQVRVGATVAVTVACVHATLERGLASAFTGLTEPRLRALVAARAIILGRLSRPAARALGLGMGLDELDELPSKLP